MALANFNLLLENMIADEDQYNALPDAGNFADGAISDSSEIITSVGDFGDEMIKAEEGRISSDGESTDLFVDNGEPDSAEEADCLRCLPEYLNMTKVSIAYADHVQEKAL